MVSSNGRQFTSGEPKVRASRPSRANWTLDRKIVRRAVAPLSPAASVAVLRQRRFETGSGGQAQCDWGQIAVPLDGVRSEIHIFVMTLGDSRRGFALGLQRATFRASPNA